MENHIEVLKTIHEYLKNNLSVDEIDELWIQFLENPDYFRWFEIEIVFHGKIFDTSVISI